MADPAAQTAPPKGRYSFVTVAFRGELALLRLQARSFARHLDPALLGEIVVVLNDHDEAAAEAAVSALRADYGALQGKLRLVRATSLFRWDVGPRGALGWRRIWNRILMWHPWVAFRSRGTAWRHHGGWKMQMALKMLAARTVTTERMVIIDTKQHYIGNITEADLTGATGKPLIPVSDRNSVWHTQTLVSALRWFGLRAEQAGAWTVSNDVPFVAPTAAVRQACDAVEAVAGPLHVLLCQRRARETEFMLINAYCLAAMGGLDQVFDADDAPPLLMKKHFSEAELDACLDACEAGQPLMSVHRAVFPRLTARQRQRVVRLWQRAELIDGLDEAMAVLRLGAPDGRTPSVAEAAP